MKRESGSTHVRMKALLATGTVLSLVCSTFVASSAAHGLSIGITVPVLDTLTSLTASPAKESTGSSSSHVITSSDAESSETIRGDTSDSSMKDAPRTPAGANSFEASPLPTLPFMTPPVVTSERSQPGEIPAALLATAAQSETPEAHRSILRSTGHGWELLGVPWYWWLLIVALVASLVYAFAGRRNQEV